MHFFLQNHCSKLIIFVLTYQNKCILLSIYTSLNTKFSLCVVDLVSLFNGISTYMLGHYIFLERERVSEREKAFKNYLFFCYKATSEDGASYM